MYKTDYERSRAKEIEFENYIKTQYKCKTEHTPSDKYFPYWDISTTALTTNAVIKYEVKYNSNYKSNTVVIENARIIDKMSHPSGLSLTQSDYYVLTFENDSNFYLINTDKLKELVDDNKNPKKRIVYDNSNYQLHIFDKPYLLSFCFVV